MFGNFRIVSRLGRGGMGEVWLAEQQSIGTRVAVKLLNRDISADAEHVQRFFNEARAVSRIQHAGIVKIFDVGFHPSGHAYLVMEFLDGESLGSRIRRTLWMGPPHIADLGKQIAGVLEATHTAGITHRDLKPDNIFIVADRELASRQRAKVLDFGIAKLTGTLAHASPRTMGTMGTPAYMAPEQWGDASRVDWRADIYSLGCLVFEMACGRPPFVVTTLAEACGKHLTEVPPRASSIVSGVPAELDELIACMLEKRPDDRPQSMEVVVKRFDAIAAIVGPPPPMTLPSPNVDPAHPSSPSGRGGAWSAGLDATAGTEVPGHHPGLAPTVGTDPPERRAAGTAPRVPEPIASAKRSKAPFAIAALLLLGVAGGAAAYVLRGRGPTRSATPPAPPIAIALPAQPPAAFVCESPMALPSTAGESSSEVTLRYGSAIMKESEVTSTLHSTWNVDEQVRRESAELTLTIVSTLDWGLMLGETFTAELVIRKISVDRETTREEAGKPAEVETVRWRSEDPDAPPALEPLRAAIGWPLAFKMTTRGQIVNDNTRDLQDMLRAKKLPQDIVELFTRDELFRTMFIELPEEPIKVGARWRGGELLRKLPSRGQIAAVYEFRVARVSGNAKQVVIETRPALKLDLSGRIKELSPKQTAFQMWTVFDVTRGELTSTEARACARMSIEHDGKPVRADAVLHQTGASRAISLIDQAAAKSPLAQLPEKPPADAVVIQMARLTTQVSQCGTHQRALKSVTVRVEIAPDGSVASAWAAGSAPLKACVEPLFKQLLFPQSVLGDIVTKDFALMPGGA